MTYYKIENNEVITSDNIPNVSNYGLILSKYSIENRKILGWFSKCEHSDVLEPTVSIEDDCIYIPKPQEPVIPVNPNQERIEALRLEYKNTTHQFCTLAEISIVDKLDTPDIQTQIAIASDGIKALPLTQLAFKLFILITDLRRLDGDDAWDKIV